MAILGRPCSFSLSLSFSPTEAGEGGKGYLQNHLAFFSFTLFGSLFSFSGLFELPKAEPQKFNGTVTTLCLLSYQVEN